MEYDFSWLSTYFNGFKSLNRCCEESSWLCAWKMKKNVNILKIMWNGIYKWMRIIFNHDVFS